MTSAHVVTDRPLRLSRAVAYLDFLAYGSLLLCDNISSHRVLTERKAAGRYLLTELGARSGIEHPLIAGVVAVAFNYRQARKRVALTLRQTTRHMVTDLIQTAWFGLLGALTALAVGCVLQGWGYLKSDRSYFDALLGCFMAAVIRQLSTSVWVVQTASAGLPRIRFEMVGPCRPIDK